MKCILPMPSPAPEGALGEVSKVGAGPAHKVTLGQAGTCNEARGPLDKIGSVEHSETLTA